MSEYIMEMKNITKRYGENTVLKDVSLSVRPGEIGIFISEGVGYIKEYQPDSWITVQIVDKTSFNMTLETIQPEYEKIRCTIGFDHQQYKFTRDFFFNAFEVIIIVGTTC